eukprot:scpid108967/ scgid1041/ 
MPPPPSKCDRGSLKERDCSSATNSFSNDGSFLEHFKKRETEFSPAKTPTSSSRSDHETEENDGSRAEQCREESSSMKPTSKPAVKFGQFCGKRKALMKSQPKPKKKKEDEVLFFLCVLCAARVVVCARTCV